MFDEQFDEVGVVGKNVHRPRLDVVKYAFVEVLDLEGYERMLANTLTSLNAVKVSIEAGLQPPAASISSDSSSHCSS